MKSEVPIKGEPAERGSAEEVKQVRPYSPRLTARDGSPNNIRILIYHRVYSDANPGRITRWDVSEKVFRRHIDLLMRWGYSAITFHDYRLYLRGVVTLPKKPIIITFDDGYEEVATVALPIMKVSGVKGVVFLVGDRSMHTNNWDGANSSNQPLLNDQQVLELQSAGFELGAHSFQHRKLTELPAADAWEEIYRSRWVLEFLLNAPVDSFSYPFGMVNEQIKQMVVDAGYSLACGAYTGPAVFSADLFDLRRIRPYNVNSAIMFWFQLQSVYLHYRTLWWHIKMRIRSVIGDVKTHVRYTPAGTDHHDIMPPDGPSGTAL